MTNPKTMRASLMTRVVTAARKLGVSAAPAEVRDGRVSIQHFYALLERLDERCGPRFAFAVADDIEAADFDASGILMMTSATLGDAVRRALRFQTLWSDGERYQLTEDESQAAITMTLSGPARRAHAIMTEIAFYDLGIGGAALVGRDIPLRHIAFSHPRTPSVPYEDVFGCTLEFDATVSAISFDASAMAWPMAMNNEALEAYFLNKASEELARYRPGTSLADQVTTLLSRSLESPPATADLAAHLGMSERTLQRRLREEDTSTHGLLRDLRKRRARELLTTRVSISEIAYLLGYSEPSAFHRAFKRWFDCAPLEYRSRHR